MPLVGYPFGDAEDRVKRRRPGGGLPALLLFAAPADLLSACASTGPIYLTPYPGSYFTVSVRAGESLKAVAERFLLRADANRLVMEATESDVLAEKP